MSDTDTVPPTLSPRQAVCNAVSAEIASALAFAATTVGSGGLDLPELIQVLEMTATTLDSISDSLRDADTSLPPL